MTNIVCLVFGHAPQTHLDYIWGNLPREHRLCLRCNKTLLFKRPTKEREEELYALGSGDIRDGDTRGCQPL